MSRERISKAISGIRMEYIAECETYSPKPRKLPSEKENHMGRIERTEKHTTRKIIALVLAACLIMGLGITAYATDIFQSLISRFANSFVLETPTDELRKEQREYAEWLDEQWETRNMMEEIGNNASKEEKVETVEGIDDATITMLESYYDGEKISMACKLTVPEFHADFSFDENHPMFGELCQIGEMNPSDGYVIWSAPTQEDLERAELLYQENGKVGFISYIVFVRDHVYANGEDLGPCHSEPDEEGVFVVKPYIDGIGDVILPESCRNQFSVEVQLTVRKIAEYYWYEDGRVLRCTGEPLDIPISFTIDNINQ